MALAYMGHLQEDSRDYEELKLLPTWDMRRKTALIKSS